MTAPAPDLSTTRHRLLGIMQTSWVAQACYALAKLDIPDLLAGGPRSIGELAAASGAHPHALHRLLRALTSLSLIEQPTPEVFALTPATDLLRTDHPASVRATALFYGEEIFRSFAEIMHTMHTGEPGFVKAHGKPIYDYLNDNPVAARTFNESMSRSQVPAALTTCDLATISTLVDLGGGTGRLLADALRAHPKLHGVLQELPTSIDQARARFAAEGLSDRVELITGSFFDTIPPGGDAYALARILHNWADDRALAILRRLRATMPADSRLWVFENFVSEHTGMVDLVMLAMQEGYDRTQAQYRDLLTRAGFDVLDVRASPDPGRSVEGVIEAVPIPG